MRAQNAERYTRKKTHRAVFSHSQSHGILFSRRVERAQAEIHVHISDTNKRPSASSANFHAQSSCTQGTYIPMHVRSPTIFLHSVHRILIKCVHVRCAHTHTHARAKLNKMKTKETKICGARSSACSCPYMQKPLVNQFIKFLHCKAFATLLSTTNANATHKTQVEYMNCSKVISLTAK